MTLSIHASSVSQFWFAVRLLRAVSREEFVDHERSYVTPPHYGPIMRKSLLRTQIQTEDTGPELRTKKYDKGVKKIIAGDSL